MNYNNNNNNTNNALLTSLKVISDRTPAVSTATPIPEAQSQSPYLPIYLPKRKTPAQPSPGYTKDHLLISECLLFQNKRAQNNDLFLLL